MDERLYSINEFLLSSLNDVSEQNNPQNNQSNTCKSDLIHNDIRNKGLVPLENVHSQEEEGESAFHTRQGSFADSDSLYTEDSSLEGSCTFLEFLKDCEPQDSKSEIHSFMHQVCTFVDFCFGKVFRDSVACQNTLNRFNCGGSVQHIWKTPLGIFTGPVDITNGRPMLIGVYSSPDRTDLQTTVRVVG